MSKNAIVELSNETINEETNKKTQIYRHFVPKNKLENTENEYNMLNQFLKDDNGVKNIGIIGPFSSGKSSLIISYLNKNKKIKKKSRIISLGNYSNKNDKKIELVIVQQLLLSKHKKNFLTRLKRSIKTLLLLVSFAIILIMILFKSKIIRFPKMYLNGLLRDSIFVTSIIIFIIILTREILNNGIINQIKYGNVEIIINKNSNIVDSNIEQIISKIKESKIRYYIFEDIDRYSDANDMLIKLKEINLIVNSGVRKPVKFIYAISEETFKKGESKVKFLDAIIPTRVVLTTEKLKREISLFSSEISPDTYILLIGQKIDMRVLNAIYNDYLLFVDNMGDLNDYDQAFAIACYKNLFSSDFHKIFKGESHINYFFSEKQKIITGGKVSNIAIKTIKEISKTHPENIKNYVEERIGNKIKTTNSNNGSKDENIQNTLLKRFLTTALIHGFINESFTRVIYKNNEFKLKGNDLNFYGNVKNNILEDIKYELEDCHSLYYEFEVLDYNQKGIININYMRYLLDNNKTNEVSYIRKTISDYTELTSEILKTHIDEVLSIKEISDLVIDSKNAIVEISKLNSKVKQELLAQLLINPGYENKSINTDEKNKIVETFNDFESNNVTNDEIDLLINYLTKHEILLTKITTNNYFTQNIYKNNLFIINQDNINNYLKHSNSEEKINNKNKYLTNELTILLKEDSIIKEYINTNIVKYIKDVWLKSKKTESEDVIIELLKNQKLSKEERLEIIGNSNTIITKNLESIHSVAYQIRYNMVYAGIEFIKELIHQNKILYTINNIEYLESVGLNDYSKISIIELDYSKLNNVNVFYKLVNNTNVPVEILIKLEIEDIEKIDLRKILKDKFMLEYIKRYEPKITSIGLNHIISNKMMESYMYIIVKYNHLFDNITENMIITEYIDEILVILIENNLLTTFENIVSVYPKDILENSKLDNTLVVEKLIEYTLNNPANIELILKLFEFKKDLNIIVNQIKLESINEKNLYKVLISIGSPYDSFGKDSKPFDIDTINEDLVSELKNKKFIWSRKYKDKNTVHIRLLPKVVTDI